MGPSLRYRLLIVCAVSSVIALSAWILCRLSYSVVRPECAWYRNIAKDAQTHPRFLALDCDSARGVVVAGRYNPEFSQSHPSRSYIALFDCEGELQWRRNIGDGVNSVECRAVATDTRGDIFVAGEFSDELRLGSGDQAQSLSALGSEYFLCKLDGNGNLIWAVSGFGGQQVETDALGAVYTLSSSAAWDLVGDETAEQNRTAVAKLTGDGEMLRFVNMRASVDLSDVEITDDGELLLSGDFNYWMGDSPFVGVEQMRWIESDEPPTRSSFLCKFDAELKPVWGIRWGSSIASIDSNNGAIYMSGSFIGDIDADPGPGVAEFHATDLPSAFLSKYGSEGTFVWGKYWIASKGVRAVDVTSAENGFTYVTGEFDGSCGFGLGAASNPFESRGGRDGYVLTIDESGTSQNVTVFGDSRTRDDAGLAIDIDENGDVFLAGNLSGRSFLAKVAR